MVVMPNDAVSLLIVTLPPVLFSKSIPSTPAGGAMACVRLLTLSVVTGGVVKSGVPPWFVIPVDWSPMQVAVAPLVEQASGPACAPPPVAAKVISPIRAMDADRWRIIAIAPALRAKMQSDIEPPMSARIVPDATKGGPLFGLPNKILSAV